MGLQTYKCQCGQEFEDSEFILCRECEDCRVNTPIRHYRSPSIDAAIRSLEQATRVAAAGNWHYMPQSPQYYGPGQYTPHTVVGDTIQVQRPTRFTIEGPIRFINQEPQTVSASETVTSTFTINYNEQGQQ